MIHLLYVIILYYVIIIINIYVPFWCSWFKVMAKVVKQIERLIDFVDIKESKNISDKLGIITGASSGLGKDLALKLIDKCWNLILIGRRHDEMKKLIPKNYGSIIRIFICDLSNQQKVVKLCGDISEYLSSNVGCCNLFVHCAGAGKFGMNIKNTSIDDWNWQMNLNVTSLFLLTKCLTPYLVQFNPYILLYWNMYTDSIRHIYID